MIIYKCDRCLTEMEEVSFNSVDINDDKVADLCESCTTDLEKWLDGSGKGNQAPDTAIPNPININDWPENESTDPTPLQVEEAIQSTTDQPPFIQEVTDTPAEEGQTDAQMPSMPE